MLDKTITELDIWNLTSVGNRTKEKIIQELRDKELREHNKDLSYRSDYPISPNTIVLGDCIEEMRYIPDNSVDLIITDLPYGQTKNKWDNVINLNYLWKSYNRIIKENGAIILFGQGLFTQQLILSNQENYRYSLVWEKDRPSGFLNAQLMPLRSHEDILVFYKSLPTYNPQMWEGKPQHSNGTSYLRDGYKEVNNNYGYINYKNKKNRKGNTTKYPRSVLKFTRPHPPIHPTQKPVELIEYLIKTFSNENEVVLDSTMGSGTTCLACINTNRKYIGIENNIDYYNLVKERLYAHGNN